MTHKERFDLVVGFTIYVILVLISPILKIRIGELESRAIGHFSISIEIYLSELEIGIHKKGSRTFDIFYMNEQICNEFLVKKWRQIFRIGNRKLLEPILLFLMKFNPKSKHLVPIKNWRSTRFMFEDSYGALERTSSHIKFTEIEHEQALGALRNLGINDDDKVVLFHARDPNYREGVDALPGHRDSTSEQQMLAMLAMVERGYKVVRVGSNVRKELNISNPNIIDYSRSKLQTDFMDIYLLYRCSFMVCNGSGLELMGLVFRKRLVCVSLSEWRFFDCFTSRQYPLFIPKKFKYSKTGEMLNLREIQKLGCNAFTSKEQFQELEIMTEDNSPEEIRDVVIEMADLVENNFSYEATNLQKIFSKQVKLREKRAIPFLIGSKYIENNRYLIDLNL